jgi:protoporphyrinogen oxidase
MEDFIFALKKYLNSELILSENYQEVREDNYLICTDAKDASLLLADRLPKISKLLEEIEYTSTSTTTVISSSEIKDLKRSFGVLIPPKNSELKTQGILNNSAIFSGRTTKSRLSSYTFISKYFEDDLSLIDEDLKNMKLDFSISEAEYKKTINWPTALPKYNLKRFNTTKKLVMDFSKTNGVAIFGNYLDGISIRELNSMAKNFAKELKLISH